MKTTVILLLLIVCSTLSFGQTTKQHIVVKKHRAKVPPPDTVNHLPDIGKNDADDAGFNTIPPPPPPPQVVPDTPDAKVFTVVEIMPEFPGDMNQYIAQHIHYPDMERDAGISGTVYVSFVIERDGTVDNVKILKSAHANGLDKEALRVVSIMPKWTPGMMNGTAVRVQFNLPIRFILK